MRVLIVADIHGNVDALQALDAWRARQPPFDAVWVVGDLVDYGPAPAEVVAWAHAHAAIAVRGNHDHAMATGESCRSSALFLGPSVATRTYWRPRLDRSHLDYLASLPLQGQYVLDDGRRAVLSHACPRDPLFGYVPTHAPDAEWRQALASNHDAGFLFVGHTHDQFVRTLGPTMIVNPGSLGFPIDGDPRAAFAVFDHGVVRLYRIPYDVERAVSRLMGLSIEITHRAFLEHVLRYGRTPETVPPAPAY